MRKPLDPKKYCKRRSKNENVDGEKRPHELRQLNNATPKSLLKRSSLVLLSCGTNRHLSGYVLTLGKCFTRSPQCLLLSELCRTTSTEKNE